MAVATMAQQTTRSFGESPEAVAFKLLEKLEKAFDVAGKPSPSMKWYLTAYALCLTAVKEASVPEDVDETLELRKKQGPSLESL